MKGIDVRDLRFAYGSRAVLSGISFHFEGGVLCVLGPNGVGKSTLFRCVLGLERRYAGLVRIEGRDVGACSPRELAALCAYVPQSQAPPSGYSVFEMVLMGAGGRRRLFPPGKAQRMVAERALERVGIAHLGPRDYARISGGERQLALIARALAQGGRVLVMDEPTANLDYGNQLRVLAEIRRMADKGDLCIMMSTHHPEQALRAADAVLALDGGQVAAFGAPGDVVDAPLIERLYQARVRMERTMDGHLIAVPL